MATRRHETYTHIHKSYFLVSYEWALCPPTLQMSQSLASFKGSSLGVVVAMAVVLVAGVLVTGVLVTGVLVAGVLVSVDVSGTLGMGTGDILGLFRTKLSYLLEEVPLTSRVEPRSEAFRQDSSSR